MYVALYALAGPLPKRICGGRYDGYNRGGKRSSHVLAESSAICLITYHSNKFSCLACNHPYKLIARVEFPN